MTYHFKVLMLFFPAMIMFVVCAILAFIRGYQAYYIALTMTFVFGENLVFFTEAKLK